ncbi:DUF3048 domain-containing protein [Isoptericola sp. BMS4]|uniref:DUF3048 domain-containing protein n=1 Tax=Isoptericola sp. BMS4 TaxID=2527875 RepID=UPI001423AB24|nr:DUF3048 domain-containing protein [Isoptericola sp. BMS4]
MPGPSSRGASRGRAGGPAARRADRRHLRPVVTVGTTLALLATAACGAEPAAPPTVTATPDPAVAKTAPPAPVVPEPPKPEPVVWPLTGKRTDTVPKRPSVAVKIENSPAARPHTGLHRADVVWEQVVEGGISRFVAVYHSDLPRQVGPVRSVRPMDPGIVAPMHGILAYSGGQPPFIAGVRRSGIQSVIMDRGDPGFRRSAGRAAPHDVYGNVRTFADQANGSRAAPPPAQFDHARRAGKATPVADGGRRGHRADVRLSTAQRTVWQWKAKRHGYVRSDGTTPSTSSGTRVAARNVLLLSVAVENTRYRDPGGAPVPKTRMVDRGKGVLLTGGKSVEVRWDKPSVRKKITLRTRSGDPVRLAPGNLWVELVPRDGGSWQVR